MDLHRRLSDDIFPKDDLREILERVTKAGLEPFGEIRERGLSNKSKITQKKSLNGELNSKKNSGNIEYNEREFKFLEENISRLNILSECES